MNSVEKIGLALGNAYSMLNSHDGDNACLKLNTALKELGTISHLDPHYQEWYARLNNAFIELKDVADTISSESDNIYYDAREYERINTRIDTIKKVFKKYGGDLTNVIAYFDDISAKVVALENSGDTLIECTHTIARLEGEIMALQDKLSALRHKASDKLSARIVEVIRTLGIPNARLEVAFNPTATPYTRKGGEEVDFMFSANTGFAPRPLAKIISGGEMSRFMLAYKTVVAQLDGIDSMVFDEIDSGISGNIGQQVALNLNSLSSVKQIIAITHLPSIASFADRHLLVSKVSDQNTTHSVVTPLDEDGIVREVARMLGSGDKEEGLRLASAMRASAKEQKNMNR